MLYTCVISHFLLLLTFFSKNWWQYETQFANFVFSWINVRKNLIDKHQFVAKGWRWRLCGANSSHTYSSCGRVPGRQGVGTPSVQGCLQVQVLRQCFIVNPFRYLSKISTKLLQYKFFIFFHILKYTKWGR